MDEIAIYGAGGFGREVARLIEQVNDVKPEWSIVGFFDDGQPEGSLVSGYPVLGGIHRLNHWPAGLHLVLAIGTPQAKKRVLSQMTKRDIFFPVLVHPSAIIGRREYVEVGEGSIICAGTIITTHVSIGKHVILNLSCTVGHESKIGDMSSFMPSCNISGDVVIGEENYWGTGAKVIQGKRIGNDVVVGAGAVVVDDLPDHVTVVGVPAKIIRKHSKQTLREGILSQARQTRQEGSVSSLRKRMRDRLASWMVPYRFWMNLMVHSMTFILSYRLSLIMLESLFVRGEAVELFNRTFALLLFLRVVSFWYHDLFDGSWVHVGLADLVNIIRATVISSFVLAAVGVIWEVVRIPQKVVLLDMVFCIMLLSGLRLVIHTLRASYLSGSQMHECQEIILAGPLDKVKGLAEELLSDPLAYFKPVGIVNALSETGESRLRISDLPVFSIQKAISRRERLRSACYMAIYWPYATQRQLNKLVKDLKPLNLPFITIPYFEEISNMGAELNENLDSSTPLASNREARTSREQY